MRESENLIEQWRATLRANVTVEALDELEDHLRQTVAQLVATGASEADAFHIAAKRIGPPKQIAGEFNKVTATDWWPMKLALIFASIGTIALFAFFLALGLRDKPLSWLLATHVLTVTAGYTGTLVLGALGLCYVVQRCAGDFGVARQAALARACVTFATIALALSAIGVGLGSVWAKLSWGRFWGWDSMETGGLAIVVWLSLFVMLGRSRRMSAHAITLLAIFGNIVVSFGWFGANAVRLNYYSGASAMMVIVMTVSHLLAIAIGLMPAGRLRLHRAN